MKLIDLRGIALIATFVASVPAGADEPPKKPGQPKPDGTLEKKHGYADVNGLKMYYEIHGTGKPLVVLHGAFGFATAYPALAKGRQLVAVEQQGHGHTA